MSKISIQREMRYKISKQWEKMNKIEKLKYLIKQKGDCSMVSCTNCPLEGAHWGVPTYLIAKEMLKKEIKKELMGKINE